MRTEPRFVSAALLSLAAVAGLSCIEEIEDPYGLGDKPQEMFVAAGDYIVWRKAELAQAYTSLLVKPLAFQRYHLGWFRSIRGPSLVNSRRAYAAAMRSVLADRYPFVTRSGEGTLLVQAALTDRILNPKLVQALRAQGRRVDREGNVPIVVLEIEFHDAGTGELVAVLATAARSHVFRRDLSQPPADAVIQQTYRPFALRLRAALDQHRWSAMGR